MSVWKMRENQAYEFLARLANSVPVCWESEPDRWRSLVADVVSLCRKMQRKGFSAPTFLKTVQYLDNGMTIFVEWSMGIMEVSMEISSRIGVTVKVETMCHRDGTVASVRYFTDMDRLEALFRVPDGMMGE